MPPTNDPPRRHLKQPTPRPGRNSKPKFELPALHKASVGWVYRADEVPARSWLEDPPAQRGKKPENPDSKTNPFLVAGIGLIFIGVGTIGIVSLATFGLIAAPIRLTWGMLNSD